jgi:hypothetical protein
MSAMTRALQPSLTMFAASGDGFKLGSESLPIRRDQRRVCSIGLLGMVRKGVASR